MTRQGILKAVRILLLVAAGAAITVYLAALGYLYINQRNMLYAQVQGYEKPDIKGLPIQDIS